MFFSQLIREIAKCLYTINIFGKGPLFGAAFFLGGIIAGGGQFAVTQKYFHESLATSQNSGVAVPLTRRRLRSLNAGFFHVRATEYCGNLISCPAFPSLFPGWTQQADSDIHPSGLPLEILCLRCCQREPAVALCY